MKTTESLLLVAASLTLVPLPGFTATRFVNLNNASPAFPYATWPAAATNIQDAIDAAVAGDEIVVTNGVYATGGRVADGNGALLTNRVAVTKPVTVRSVNGPAVTWIAGHWVPGKTNGIRAMRCVYLTNGASLIGFTLTNGATRPSQIYAQDMNGGGVWCESTDALVSNCVLVGNSAINDGGGAYGGTLNNCTLIGNATAASGGGAFDSSTTSRRWWCSFMPRWAWASPALGCGRPFCCTPDWRPGVSRPSDRSTQLTKNEHTDDHALPQPESHGPFAGWQPGARSWRNHGNITVAHLLSVTQQTKIPELKIMKRFTLKLATLALFPAALLTITSCSSTSGDKQGALLTTDQGVAIVDTIKTSATVTAIDAKTRKVTLTMADGKRKVVKCGPEVVNFPQIQINDRVNITHTEEFAVFLGRGNAPSAAGETAVALAPVGAKPGGIIADTVEITAKITAIDTKTRKVTLTLADGSKKVVKVGNKVDLTGVTPGDDVTVQHTEALAITVEKP